MDFTRTDMAHVTDGRVRTSPLLSLPELMENFAVPLSPLLEQLGLPADLLDDAENTIPVQDAAELLALCAEHARCPHLGLLVGQQLSLENFGLLGLLARNQADVGTALRGIIDNQHLHGRAGVPALTVTGDVAIYSLTLKRYYGAGTRHIHDLCAGMGFNLMKALCGPSWEPTEILLPHSAPDDRRPFDRFFRAPIQFDAEWIGVAFPSRWLSHRVTGADPELLSRLQKKLHEVAARHARDLVMQTRRALYVLVMQGNGSMQSVADQVGLHRRTLNRRLAERGTSTFLLLEEVKSQIARQLVSDTTLSMIEISSVLGYSNASTFTRAFQRWSHTTPSRWRGDLEQQSHVGN